MFGLFLAYWLVMAPNYTLSNSIAFRNLARPDRDFGKVRLWGTVGWMAVGWIVSGVMAWSGSKVGQGVSEAFWIAVVLSVITAVYCRTLPDTPPLTAGGPRTSSFRDVTDLARSPSMPVYLILAFGVSLTTRSSTRSCQTTCGRSGWIERGCRPRCRSGNGRKS